MKRKLMLALAISMLLFLAVMGVAQALRAGDTAAAEAATDPAGSGVSAEIIDLPVPEVEQELPGTAREAPPEAADAYSPNEAAIAYINADGSERTAASCVSLTPDAAALSSGWYAVMADVTIPERIQVSGEAHLILCDGCTLNAPKGISVRQGNALAIYGQSAQSGKLVIDAVEDGSAGIGGEAKQKAGSVVINGGDLAVTGGANGAGIGSGLNGIGGEVVVNRCGRLEAAGGQLSAGIGSGASDNWKKRPAECKVRVRGGRVNAVGGGIDNDYGGGAGIGGGNHRGADVAITGGSVHAEGGRCAAGIGGGYCGNDVSVAISGGTVTAESGRWAAGIGGGYQSGDHDAAYRETIDISGGSVTASGNEGAGIGSGALSKANAGVINISGGRIRATALHGSAAAAIGGGLFDLDPANAGGGAINISGGQIVADGDYGIGGTRTDWAEDAAITLAYSDATNDIRLDCGRYAGSVTLKRDFQDAETGKAFFASRNPLSQEDKDAMAFCTLVPDTRSWHDITAVYDSMRCRVRTLVDGAEVSRAKESMVVSIEAEPIIRRSTTIVSIAVKDAAGKRIPVERNAFVMPDGDVTVEVVTSFLPLGEGPDYALLAKLTATGQRTLTLSWTKVDGAEGYDVRFGPRGGTPDRRSVGGRSYRFEGLEKATVYRASVRAWTTQNGKKLYLGKASPAVYAVTGGYTKEVCNPKAVTARRRRLALKAGETARIEATVTGVNPRRALLQETSALRYYSSDAGVATVNRGGKVSAVAAGRCTIWVVANNGVRTAVRVTVK